MTDILLTRDSSPAATYVSNTFIDKYMTHADGEFVKVYLYLLRCINDPDTPFSISGIADTFDYTEKDVKRALKYWEKMQLLRLEFNDRNELSGICLTDGAASGAQKQSSGDHRIYTDYDHGSARKTSTAAVSSLTLTPTSAPTLISAPTSTLTSAPTLISAPISASEKIIPYNPPAPSAKDNGCHLLSNEPGQDRSYHLLSAEPAQERDYTLLTGESVNVSQPVLMPVHRTAVQTAHQAETADSRLAYFHPDENVQELLYVAERYLGHQLNPIEADTILYWMDKLGFSQDLIDYLIEQCVAKGRPNIQYMDKIALDWAQHSVHTLSEAKQAMAERSLTVYAVKKAFGISDRSLADYEQEHVQRWTEQMGFSDEVIALACQKTLQSTQKINFNYANSILENWQTQNVHTLADIELLDDKHKKMQTKKYAAAKKAAVQASIQASVRSSKNAAINNYNSYSQRNYDYEALERELLTR